MRAFWEAVADCHLVDLGLRGLPYTWDNRQAGTANVKAYLDRALAELRSSMGNAWPRTQRSFRYENVWQSHSQCDQLVRNLWRTGAGQGGLQGVVDALTIGQKDLGAWGEREFGNLSKRVRKLQKRLERLRGSSLDRGPREEELSAVVQLREALRQEEIWLKYKPRVMWLREGIAILDQVEVKAEINEFYHALYQTQGFSLMDDLLNCMQPSVTDQMNEYIKKPFLVEEVKRALFDMAPSKAPGMDGFTSGFYQRHWDVLGEDITADVLEFLNGGELPLGLNDTT
ncbi:hypothetical protein D1007_45617 [Hordeum vulgare]|nr:hypothetical protein D1007_45617 [Hordeum vulgare]